jgi:hypothetical protein
MLTVFADVTPLGAIFLGLVPVGAIWFVLAFAGADAAYFDPRPLLARAARAEAVYPLLREFDNARHASREALREDVIYARLTLRETAITAAALLALLIPTSPEGATR